LDEDDYDQAYEAYYNPNKILHKEDESINLIKRHSRRASIMITEQLVNNHPEELYFLN